MERDRKAEGSSGKRIVMKQSGDQVEPSNTILSDRTFHDKYKKEAGNIVAHSQKR